MASEQSHMHVQSTGRAHEHDTIAADDDGVLVSRQKIFNAHDA
jgi:hypothetical protein